MLYATLEELRRNYLGFKDDETADDHKLLEFLDTACTTINHLTGRRYDIRRETMLFNYPIRPRNLLGVYSIRNWVEMMNAVGDVNRRSLSMMEDLITVYEVVNGDSTVIDATDYILEPNSIYPKNKITLSDYNVTWKYADKTRKQVIQVDGLWGYIKDPDNMWVASGDILKAAIDNDDSTLTVADVTGYDGNRKEPRFSIGQLLKFASATEFEYMTIIDIEKKSGQQTVDTIYVKRGSNGTDAIAWLINTPIFTFRPWRNVEQATCRLATYYYRTKDVDTFDKQQSQGGGIIPSSIPKEVLQLLPPKRIKIKP